MVNVIVGQKGSGKTKELIEAIQSAVKNENGDIVCIEKGNSLRYDVSYRVRLVDAEEYKITNFDQLTGFVSGLHAGNFDITHVFIDNLYNARPSARGIPSISPLRSLIRRTALTRRFANTFEISAALCEDRGLSPDL